VSQARPEKELGGMRQGKRSGESPESQQNKKSHIRLREPIQGGSGGRSTFTEGESRPFFGGLFSMGLLGVADGSLRGWQKLKGLSFLLLEGMGRFGGVGAMQSTFVFERFADEHLKRRYASRKGS